MRVSFRTASTERIVETSPEELLTESARRAGFALNTRCGGKGICRGCVVVLQEGRFRYRDVEQTADPDNVREVRACQCVPLTEGSIFIAGNSMIETSAKIEDSFLMPSFEPAPVCRLWEVRLAEATLATATTDAQRLRRAIVEAGGPECVEMPLPALRQLAALAGGGAAKLHVIGGLQQGAWRVLHLARAGAPPALLGVAVDVGTTTVAAALVDLANGRILRKASRYNGQIERADDVGSRIGYCSGEEHLRELQRLVVLETLNPLIAELCRAEGAETRDIYTVALSGNTVMTHLFLGISPEGMGRVPFHPVEKDFADLRAAEVGIDCNTEAILRIVPSIAGYVGGDITSDLLIAGMPREGETAMLVDIGTNGEIVLAHKGEMLACATAAGPAFEGYGIRHGCRAATGAIDGMSFDMNLDIHLNVIGETLPAGICGTGIIAFMASGIRAGIINRFGRFNLDALRRKDIYLLIEGKELKAHGCVVAPKKKSATGYPLHISEPDVAQILKAKAAIFAGMKTLLDERGLTFGDIDRFVLAGGFGRHLRLDEAIIIGLIPEIPLARFDVIGNGSLAGACLALLDETAHDSFHRIADIPHVIELNLTDSFETNFIDALAMPNMEGELFAATIANLPDWQS